MNNKFYFYFTKGRNHLYCSSSLCMTSKSWIIASSMTVYVSAYDLLCGPGQTFCAKIFRNNFSVWLPYVLLPCNSKWWHQDKDYFWNHQPNVLYISFCQQDSIPAHSKGAALKLFSLSQSLDSSCCWNHSWSWLNPAVCCGMNWAGKLRHHQQFCCASMDFCIDQQML